MKIKTVLSSGEEFVSNESSTEAVQHYLQEFNEVPPASFVFVDARTLRRKGDVEEIQLIPDDEGEQLSLEGEKVGGTE